MKGREEDNRANGGPGFGVPGDYFNNSAGAIVNRIECLEELRLYPLLASAKGKLPFVVPEAYFEGNEAVLEMLFFPVIRTLPKQNPFAVPEAYFNDTLERLKPALPPRQEARIITFPLRSTLTAIAAALVIALGIWVYSSYMSSTDCGGIACVDKHDIIESKVFQSIDDEELYDVVDVDKLEEKLGGGKTERNYDSTGDERMERTR
jgi:hypothetical protein